MGKYTILAYNEKKAQAASKLQKHSLGKGKILKTIDKIAISACAVLEVVRELPGFEYLKAISIGNLTTKFNTWIATITTHTPNLEGLTAEQIYELGQKAALDATVSSANSIGLVFSAILEFVLNHPTVTVMGIATLTTILMVPFKALINKIRGNKELRV